MTHPVPVTVVVSAFNNSLHLEGTLKALRAQTKTPEQVIVVDDGSTDDTVAIAKSMGVQVVQQHNKGPGAARNRGLESAKTEFVAFCDADDWYVPDKLSYTVDLLDKLGASCAASEAWVVRGDYIEGRMNQHYAVPEALTFEFLLQRNPVVCSSMVARRKALEQVGGFDESPELHGTEDYDLCLRLAPREPIAYSSRPMTFRRVGPLCVSDKDRYVSGVDEVLTRVVKGLGGDPHSERLAKRGRAATRLNLARRFWADGNDVEARQIIKEAQRLAPSWRGFKMRLRSLLSR